MDRNPIEEQLAALQIQVERCQIARGIAKDDLNCELRALMHGTGAHGRLAAARFAFNATNNEQQFLCSEIERLEAELRLSYDE